MVPEFKNAGERSTTKNYYPVSLLSVVSKVFEKLVNNMLVDHPEKCSLFSGFQYDLKKKKNFMAPFYGWGSTASRLEPLRGGSLLITTKFPEVPGTHSIDLGRMKG